MAKYRFGDVVKEVKINVNRDNNPYEFYVAGDHLDSEDLIIRRKGRFSTDDVGPAFTRIFHPGQVLYGSRRTYLKKVAIADFDGICANTTFVLETKDNNIFTQELLPFIMLSDRFTEWSVSHSKGSTNPYVLFSDLADFEIELPDINSQRSLAKKLASAHNVKESYKTLLKCTDELVKSQFIEMFGSRDFLKRLGDYVSVKTGKLDANASVEGGRYPFFTCAEKTLSIDTYEFDCNAVLLAGNGEFCVKHYDGKFNAYQRTYVIESKDESILSTKYLYAWLKDYANILKANAIGGVIKYIKLGDIINAQINLPSQDRQLEYVKIYEQAH